MIILIKFGFFFTKEKREKYATILLEYAEKGGWNGEKNKLDNYFQDAKISLDTYQKKMVLNDAMKMYKANFMNKKANYLNRIDLQDDIAKFFEDYYIKTLDKEDFKEFKYFLKNIEIIPRISAYWVLGISQEEIASFLKKKPNLINIIIKTFRESSGLPKKYQYGYVFEKYNTEKFDLFLDGHIGKPDFYVRNKDEKILGPGEIKIFDQYRNSITLSLDKYNDSNKCLKPSYLYCKKNGIRFFPLIFRMNKWLDVKTSKIYNYVIPIDIYGKSTFPINRYYCHEKYRVKEEFSFSDFFSKEFQDSLVGHAINSIESK